MHTDVTFGILVGEQSYKLLCQPGVIDWTKMYMIYSMCILVQVFQFIASTLFTVVKECIAEYLMKSLFNPMGKEYGCLRCNLVEKFVLMNPISHQHRYMYNTYRASTHTHTCAHARTHVHACIVLTHIHAHSNTQHNYTHTSSYGYLYKRVCACMQIHIYSFDTIKLYT